MLRWFGLPKGRGGTSSTGSSRPPPHFSVHISGLKSSPNILQSAQSPQSHHFQNELASLPRKPSAAAPSHGWHLSLPDPLQLLVCTAQIITQWFYSHVSLSSTLWCACIVSPSRWQALGSQRQHFPLCIACSLTQDLSLGPLIFSIYSFLSLCLPVSFLSTIYLQMTSKSVSPVLSSHPSYTPESPITHRIIPRLCLVIISNITYPT